MAVTGSLAVKNTLSFERDFIKQPSFFSLPDSSVANRPEDVGTPYITNPFPTIKIDEASINKGQSIDVEVEMSAIENISGDLSIKKSWFTDINYVKNLRVRVLACFDDKQTEDLDYLSQRFNEYQAGLMNIKGPVSSEKFLTDLISQGSDNLSVLLSSEGPLDVNELTQVFKKSNTQHKTLIMNGGQIQIYDAPIGSLFINNSKGTPQSSVLDKKLLKKSRTSKKSNVPTYKQRRVNLKTIKFALEPRASEVTQMSFYVLVYNDKFEVLKNFGVDVKPSVGSLTDILQTGMGFITDFNYLGQKTTFKKQTKGSPPTLMSTEKKQDAPLKNSLIDKTFIKQTNKQANPSKYIRSSINNDINSAPSKKTSGQLVKAEGYFSPLWVTKCDGDNAKYAFVFDKKRFLMNKSLFPWLFVNQGSLEEILKMSEVLDIQMKKRRVHYKGYTTNRVGTSTRSIPYELSCYDPEEVIKSPSRRDIYMGGEDSQKSICFQGYDDYSEHKKSQSILRNQYGVSIYIKDPSLEYIKNAIISLRNIETGLRNIYDTARYEGKYYNAEAKKLSTPLNKIPYRGNNALSESKNLLTEYAKYFTTFSNRKKSQRPSATGFENTESKTLRSLVATINNKNLDGFSVVIGQVQSLVDSLATIIKAYLPKDSYNIGDPVEAYNILQKGPSPTKVNVIEIHHYFSNLFEFGRQCNTGYNYVIDNEEEGGFNRQTTGLTAIKRSVYLERIGNEFNKYFGSYSTPESPGTTANAFSEAYAGSTYAYLTPKTIQIHGSDPVNQLEYRKQGSNELSFDIDKYAKLFSNLVKVRKNTKYLNFPFYMLNKDSTLKDDILGSLFHHECSVEMTTEEQFSPLSVRNIKKRSIPSEVSELKTTKVSSLDRDLMPLIYGGAGDESAGTRSFIDTTSLKLKPSIFSQPSFFDLRAAVTHRKTSDPIKLMFALLGELEVTPQVVSKDYESQEYNSLINNAIKSLKLTSLNVKPSIEGIFSYLPNQLKSMFVVATSVDPVVCEVADSQPQQQVSTTPENCPEGNLGDGFDAMRIKLEDIDAGFADQLISFIPPGVKELPYEKTKDPMKVFSKFLTFWMNYKQICVVEYLDGFESADASSAPSFMSAAATATTLKKRPMWSLLNQEILEENPDATFLCRIRTASSEDYRRQTREGLTDFEEMTDSMDLFDLPIYNEYFLLGGTEQATSVGGTFNLGPSTQPSESDFPGTQTFDQTVKSVSSNLSGLQTSKTGIGGY